MYQLIALDMDGTLLNEDKEISKRTREAIAQAKSMGKTVIIATGRPIKGVGRYIEELNLNSEQDYVVTFNGALVQSTKDHKIIMDMPLNVEAYRELYALSKELDVHIHALTDDSVLTPKNNPYTEIEASINQIPIVEGPVEEVREDTMIVKVMFIDAPEVLDRVIEELPDWVRGKYSVLRSTPYFLEFLDPRVNKGAGVKAVAERLGIDHKKVICVGDAGNDLAMIEYAKLGVAMENATEDVKAVADYITKSNEDDGVAHVIEKFLIS